MATDPRMIEAVTSPTEELIRSQLADLGWSVARATDESTDFEIVGKADDERPFRIRGMSGFTAMMGVSHPIGDPHYFRIEVGQVPVKAERWGQWSTSYGTLAQDFARADLPVGMFGYQAIADASGAVLFVGTEMGAGHPATSSVVADAVVLGLRECESLYRPTTTQSRDAIEPWRSPSILNLDQAPKAPNLLPAGILLTLLLGTLFGLLHAPAFGVLSVVVAVLTLGYALLGNVKRKPDPALLRSIAELQRAFRSSDLLRADPELRVGSDLHCPVVLQTAAGRDTGRARFCSAAWQQQDPGLGLRTRVWVWKSIWPANCLQEHRLLPDSWAVIEWTGSDKVLGALAGWPRTTQEPGCVRWLLRDEELGSAAFAEACAQIVRTLRVGRDGVYR